VTDTTPPDRGDRVPPADGPTAIAIDEDGAGEVFDALSSNTARTILARLYEAPLTPSELAEAVDTSVQNAKHHLDQLGAAGLVEVVATDESDYGQEMRRYGPTNDALELTAGEAGAGDERASTDRPRGEGRGSGQASPAGERVPPLSRARWVLVGALLAVVVKAIARVLARD